MSKTSNLTFKRLLKELIPPIFFRFLHNIPIGKQNVIYRSYEDALKYSSTKGKGYEAQEIVELVVEKNKIYSDRIVNYPVFGLNELRTVIGIGLARGDKKVLRVLDFGGGGIPLLDS